jgi:hypothetical protein
MKQLFDDPLLEMFAERAIMTMTRGGADHITSRGIVKLALKIFLRA